jgi:hypothetical protein
MRMGVTFGGEVAEHAAATQRETRGDGAAATSNARRRGATCDGCPRELGRDGSHDLGRRRLGHVQP